METIRVNMTPCEDIKTIHASQNDNEAREWGFELHNNGEKIDSSSISDQLVFKAYEGGTEEILPTNGSTPTTSPFKGDIKYPQGLLSDQEFLYRESPTESDGLAKITDIKGNTLVWNQQLQREYNMGAGQGANGYFRYNRCTPSYNSSTGVYTLTALENIGVSGFYFNKSNNGANLVENHKYLAVCTVRAPKAFRLSIGDGNNPSLISVPANTTQTVYTIFTVNSSTREVIYNFHATGSTNNWDGTESVTITNIMLIDLTQLGLDVTYQQFVSLFSLPYYDYNQGTLIPFSGNGIKTVSKNQFDASVITTSYAGLVLTKTQGKIRAVYSGGSQYAGFNFYGSPVFTDTFLKGKYRLSFDVSGLDTQWTVGLRRGASFLGGGQTVAISNDGHYSFTIDAEANPNCYLSFARTGNKTTAYDVTFSNIQLELGTTETSYTPFEEKTISLPISQYFPTGMKSAGNVYDELTESKAITRIGRVDLGSLTWTYQSGNARFNANQALSSLAKLPSSNNEVANILCAKYATASSNNTASASYDLSVGLSTNGNIQIRDTNYTDATAFKTAMSGLYLYYELATPTETSFTTASLVTENGEIPLSNEDDTLIGKCTEELSSQPGFIDAKIKLTDGDGTCYSNKIQLHVERKPS